MNLFELSFDFLITNPKCTLKLTDGEWYMFLRKTNKSQHRERDKEGERDRKTHWDCDREGDRESVL